MPGVLLLTVVFLGDGMFPMLNSRTLTCEAMTAPRPPRWNFTFWGKSVQPVGAKKPNSPVPKSRQRKLRPCYEFQDSERIKIQTASKKATVCEATCGSRVGRVFVDELFFSIAIIRLKCLVFRYFNVHIYIYRYILVLPHLCLRYLLL